MAKKKPAKLSIPQRIQKLESIVEQDFQRINHHADWIKSIEMDTIKIHEKLKTHHVGETHSGLEPAPKPWWKEMGFEKEPQKGEPVEVNNSTLWPDYPRIERFHSYIAEPPRFATAGVHGEREALWEFLRPLKPTIQNKEDWWTELGFKKEPEYGANVLTEIGGETVVVCFCKRTEHGNFKVMLTDPTHRNALVATIRPLNLRKPK